VKPKHSKAIDMRYHWIRDQIVQKKFVVYWAPGASNLADFFTKALPVAKHQELKSFLITLPPQHLVTPSALNNKAIRQRNRFQPLAED
jgi:hypothetical protein